MSKRTRAREQTSSSISIAERNARRQQTSASIRGHEKKRRRVVRNRSRAGYLEVCAGLVIVIALGWLVFQMIGMPGGGNDRQSGEGDQGPDTGGNGDVIQTGPGNMLPPDEIRKRIVNGMAKALNMSPDAFDAALKQQKTVAQIANEQGVAIEKVNEAYVQAAHDIYASSGMSQERIDGFMPMLRQDAQQGKYVLLEPPQMMQR